MNVIWIVSDTFRQDHMGAYGNKTIRTPSLDALAAKSVRFDRHYAGAFPTMPTRADHATGRWTMSFMGWEPLPESETTLAQILAGNGFHTAAVVDTPFYLRSGFNYDRGFQTFFMQTGQEGGSMKTPTRGHHESRDLRAAWRHESDCNAPQTFTGAMRWLERHYKEDFFLYVDAWDPHEPWDAPAYFTELYWPGYDGEVIDPLYGHWQDMPGYTEERVNKAHATYCGEITMVDTWIGYLLSRVENMGLMDDTAIIFTSDHGFYFGEHHGLFGKLTYGKRPDGTLQRHEDKGVNWDHSPLYEEVAHIPLLVHVPGASPGVYKGLTSVVDVMPTVLDFLGQEVPEFVQGQTLLPKIRDASVPGREFAITTIPFANPGDPVHSVDNLRRILGTSPVTTVTTDQWSFLYSMDEGMSELYNLDSDPKQEENLIYARTDVANDIHQYLLKFMRDTNVAPHLLKSRQELRL